MIARARTISVVAIILGGTIAIIASTQTWLEVTLRVGATTSLPVPGAAAFPLLAPLSLAALALGLALSIVGRVLRYVFGVIAAAIGVGLLIGSGRIGIEQPLDAVAAAVTEATGLSGASAIADLVASLAVTAWPFAAAAVRYGFAPGHRAGAGDGADHEVVADGIRDTAASLLHGDGVPRSDDGPVRADVPADPFGCALRACG